MRELAGESAQASAIRRELEALGTAPGATFGRVIAGLATDAPDVLFAGLTRAWDRAIRRSRIESVVGFVRCGRHDACRGC